MNSVATKPRARKTGRYTFKNFDAICVCGRRLGVHGAEAPHDFGDDTGECDGFKPAKPAR